jgi:F-type H+-transporting ATPase subunit gamma
MPAMKAIKRRRGSVKNIQQIMKAMNLVATAKLQRARLNRERVMPFFEETDRVMLTAASTEGAELHAYIKQREAVQCSVYVVITSNRGLCGGYNMNISKEVLAHAKANGKNAKIIAIGTKGRDFFRRRRQNIIDTFSSPSESASYVEAERISKRLIALYETQEIDEVFVAYTKFETILSQAPCIEPVFPVGLRQKEREVTDLVEMEYDPDLNGFIDHMTPLYLSVFIYNAMAESIVCEEASRMTSMDSATKNAQEIIEDLTLMYNRQRQSIITQEITEIVSGANALQ